MQPRHGWLALPFLLFTQASSAEDALEHLKRVAKTYSQLTSFQVEAIAETTTTASNRTVPVLVRVALYFSPPEQTRIEVKNPDNSLQTVMIWDGDDLTEFHRWDNTYTRTPGVGLDVRFSPERGEGMGEMLYSTIASRVSSATVRGRAKVTVGSETIPCVIVDVAYGTGITAPTYSFWISEDRGIVLKRRVAFWKHGERKTLVSSVVALTFNEDIPGAIFKFSPPLAVRKLAYDDQF